MISRKIFKLNGRKKYRSREFKCSTAYQIPIYNLHNAINKEIECVEGAIDKGFAYLAVDRDLLGFQALESFFTASAFDKENKYSDVITCGVAQARSQKTICQCIISN